VKGICWKARVGQRERERERGVGSNTQSTAQTRMRVSSPGPGPATTSPPPKMAVLDSLLPTTPHKPRCFYAVEALRYAMRSLRSLSFLRPAKIILVPLMYFWGSAR
jgi:hypothetical protein